MFKKFPQPRLPPSANAFVKAQQDFEETLLRYTANVNAFDKMTSSDIASSSLIICTYEYKMYFKVGQMDIS